MLIILHLMLALEGFTEYTIIVIMHCVILCLVCLFSPCTVCIVLYCMYQSLVFIAVSAVSDLVLYLLSLKLCIETLPFQDSCK